MIDRDIIKARIRRSKIAEIAERAYHDDPASDLVQSFELSPETDFLFVLYSSPELWTSISTTHIDYRLGDCTRRISISDAAEKFHDFHFEREKGYNFEFIELDRGAGRIWVGSTQTSFALENIFILLEKELRR